MKGMNLEELIGGLADAVAEDKRFDRVEKVDGRIDDFPAMIGMRAKRFRLWDFEGTEFHIIVEEVG